MSKYAIEIKNLGKKYTLGEKQSYVALRDILSNPFQAKKETSDFWALKDINLKVKHGEVLGVIGKNGSGKSTLLKLLSRITPPTTGSIKLNGRVASLLEVGTGFNPELTGRENIFLNGSILGMSRKEIKSKFDEIVDFSGVEQFIDTPVKRYSSGMYVRLAFAVAAHLESEILLVDEVLAVGDIEFQKKCLGKMRAVTKIGKTVLFVSHNMQSIESLCKKSLLINSGCLISQGTTTKVVEKYLFDDKVNKQNLSFQKSPSDKLATIEKIQLLDDNNKVVSKVTAGKRFIMQVTYSVSHPIDKCNLDLVILKDDIPIVSVSEGDLAQSLYSRSEGIYRCNIDLQHNFLIPGRYSFEVALKYPGIEFYSKREDLMLEVKPPRDYFSFNNQGPINPQPKFTTLKLQ